MAGEQTREAADTEEEIDVEVEVDGMSDDEMRDAPERSAPLPGARALLAAGAEAEAVARPPAAGDADSATTTEAPAVAAICVSGTTHAADVAAPSAAPARPSSICCGICGGTQGLVQCGALTTARVATCSTWLHPSCAYDAGLVLSSVAHFGAELYFVLCAEHSSAPRAHEPRPPHHTSGGPAPASSLAARPQLDAGDCEGAYGDVVGCYDDGRAAAVMRRVSSSCRDGRASKLAKLAKLGQALEQSPFAQAARSSDDREEADEWWWALRADLVPPLASATECGEGAVRRGNDKREWQVVSSTNDGRAMWVPLAPDGSILRPSQLPPPMPTRPSGLPDRMMRRPLDRADWVMEDDVDGPLYTEAIYPRVRLVMSRGGAPAPTTCM